jgi:hypothetical protein
MKENFKVFEIATDGLPNTRDPKLIWCVAFIFNGCIISGWPLKNGNWEADSEVGRAGEFSGVEKYVVFDKKVCLL